jgi:membrane protein, antimicrobial resistance system
MTTPVTPSAAPAPAGPNRIPFVTDFLRMVRVLVSPTEVFEEVREQPTFWIPWVIVVVLLLIVANIGMPFNIQAARIAAASAGRPFPAAAEVTMRTVSMIVIPVITLVILLLSAGVMYVVLLASGGQARYKGLLTVVVFTAMLGILQAVLTLVVLKLRDPTTLRTAADFQVSLGLDLLLPGDASLGKFLDGVLRAVTPFSVWSLVITAIGVRTMERTSKGAAWAAATASFALGIIFAGLGGLLSGGAR